MKYIFLDFNGTVLDDVKLCFDILNTMLKENGIKEVDIDMYKNSFTFPITEYYKKVGFNLEVLSFDKLAIRFVDLYQKNSLEQSIYKDFYEFVSLIKSNDYKVVLCSASQITNLLEQTNHFDITKYFDDVIGLDNINAKSKVDLANNYIKDNNINPNNVLFIGDTIHDYEVATYCGANCALVSTGHQSIDVLKTVTNNVYNSLVSVYKEVINK